MLRSATPGAAEPGTLGDGAGDRWTSFLGGALEQMRRAGGSFVSSSSTAGPAPEP